MRFQETNKKNFNILAKIIDLLRVYITNKKKVHF